MNLLALTRDAPWLTHEPERAEPLMHQREVADLLGVTQSAVGQVERRAIRKLRAAIEQEAASEGVSVAEWLYGG